MKASLFDLRYRTKDILKAVERGEPVTLVYRGQEKALIQPILPAPPPKTLSESEAFWHLEESQGSRQCGFFCHEVENIAN